jgi:choline dehydrogenase-like flavoprotein
LFESVLNFTASNSSHVGDLEVLPALRSTAAMLGIGSGARRSGMKTLFARRAETLKAMRGISIRRVIQDAAHQSDLFFAVSLQQAESRGNVITTSADPGVQPRIDYNYLATESDLRRMRELFRTAAAILATAAFKPLFGAFTDFPVRSIDDDRVLDTWMRAHLGTAIHACGTCRMGPDPEAGAVVDQYGRVHGLLGLRVADTSILPTTPSRGPAATAIMIGERVADFIKGESAQ